MLTQEALVDADSDADVCLRSSEALVDADSRRIDADSRPRLMLIQRRLLVLIQMRLLMLIPDALDADSRCACACRF